MDFDKSLEEMYRIINEILALEGSDADNETKSQSLSTLGRELDLAIQDVMIQGVLFRSKGLEYITSDQYKFLIALTNGRLSTTALERMKKDHEEVYKLHKALKVVKLISDDYFRAILYLVKP